MTRRCLPILAGALLFCGVATSAPAPAHLRAASIGGKVEGVRIAPTRIDPSPARFELHLGDGIFRLRIRGCDTCPASVTIEVMLGELWQLIRPS